MKWKNQRSESFKLNQAQSNHLVVVLVVVVVVHLKLLAQQPLLASVELTYIMLSLVET